MLSTTNCVRCEHPHIWVLVVDNLYVRPARNNITSAYSKHNTHAQHGVFQLSIPISTRQLSVQSVVALILLTCVNMCVTTKPNSTITEPRLIFILVIWLFTATLF